MKEQNAPTSLSRRMTLIDRTGSKAGVTGQTAVRVEDPGRGPGNPKEPGFGEQQEGAGLLLKSRE